MTRDHRHKPYPELVEPKPPVGPWDIRDAADVPLGTDGAVNQVDRWMVVPLGPDGRPVSRHELAHVRYSPPTYPRVRFDPRVLAVVEDARINLALAARGLGVALDREGRAHVCMLAAKDAKRGDTFALLARAVASLGTNVEDELRDHLDDLGRAGAFVATQVDRVRDALEQARLKGDGEIAPFKRALAIARRLARELRAASLLDFRGRARTAFGKGGGCCFVHAGAGPKGLDADDERDLLFPGVGDAGGGGGAGTLSVRRVPLTVRLRRGRGGGRGWRASTEGSVVRYLQRWVPERAIFGRRRRRGGRLSVLVDTSGSMRLRDGDLDELLRATPSGARVAMYSGKGRRGELRIIAWGDRRAAARHLRPFGSGNIVDVPALEWLADQPAPRIWISDGGVTGVGDRRCGEVTEQVERLCRRHGIRRCADVDEAVSVVTGRKRPVPALLETHPF